MGPRASHNLFVSGLVFLLLAAPAAPSVRVAARPAVSAPAAVPALRATAVPPAVRLLLGAPFALERSGPPLAPAAAEQGLAAPPFAAPFAAPAAPASAWASATPAPAAADAPAAAREGLPAAADQLRSLAAGQVSAATIMFDGGGPLPTDDSEGSRLAAAIGGLLPHPVGTSSELSFRPTLGSLRRLARVEGFEMLLARRRGGNWVLVRGDVGSAPSVAGDFDLYVHNHYYHPVLAKSFTPYPSDGDLVFSAGKDARFLVVSESGVVEWSPRVPYHTHGRSRLTAAEQARLLDPARDDTGLWRRSLRRGTSGRIALDLLLLPLFYDRLLRASGVSLRLYRWNDPRLSPSFLETAPAYL